jgi:hypothetical protein
VPEDSAKCDSLECFYEHLSSQPSRLRTVGLLVVIGVASGIRLGSMTIGNGQLLGQLASSGGLLGQFWPNTFFGSPLSSCANITTVSPPISASTNTEIDPIIDFAIVTGYNYHPYNYATFSARWTGNITIATSGTYVFQLASDDGSWLYIDSVLNVNRGGVQGPGTTTGQPILLSLGPHQVDVDFYETCGGQSGIDFSWMPPGATSFAIVPQTVLSPSPSISISASSPAAASPGQSAVSTISISGLNGFVGSVSFSDSVPAGLTCGPIMPVSVVSPGTASVSCSASSPGMFSLAVTGTDGVLGNTATAVFTVVDFSVAANPAAVNGITYAGCVGTSQITVTSFGYVGKLSLAVGFGLPLSAVLDKQTVDLTSGGTATFNLYLSAYTTTSVGTTYQVPVTVFGFTPSISHQIIVQTSFTLATRTSADYACLVGGGGGSSSSLTAKQD